MQHPDGLGPREKGGPADGWFGDGPFGFDETRPLPDAAFCVIGGLDFSFGHLDGSIPTRQSLIMEGLNEQTNPWDEMLLHSKSYPGQQSLE